MIDDCVLCIFRFSDLETKMSISVLNKNIYYQTLIEVDSNILRAIQNCDTFSVAKHRKWYRYVNSKILGSLGSRTLIRAYERRYPLNILRCFSGACRHGNISIVKSMLRRGINNWDHGLLYAAMGNHISVIELLLRCAKTWHWNWNCMFIGACKGGHIDLVKRGIALGADSWTMGYLEACASGHLDIVVLLLGYSNTRELGIMRACAGGHENIINYMGEVSVSPDLLYAACRSGNMNLINRFMRHDIQYYNAGLSGACRGGCLDIVSLMVSFGATDFNAGLYGACAGGHIDIVELMISLGADDYSAPLRISCAKGKSDIVKILLEKNHGANLDACLSSACRRGWYYICDILFAAGAKNCRHCA